MGEKSYKSIQIFQIFLFFLICMIWDDLWDLLSIASRTVTVGSARSALLFLVAYGEKSYKSVQIFQIFFYPHFIVPSNSWHFFKVAVWSLFRITIGFPFGRRPLVPDIHCVGIANPDEHYPPGQSISICKAPYFGLQILIFTASGLQIPTNLFCFTAKKIVLSCSFSYFCASNG